MKRDRQPESGERAGDFMARTVSRRTVFHGLGASGGAIAAWLLAKGIVGGTAGRALAGPMHDGKVTKFSGMPVECVTGPCPPPATGVCSCESSACISGGRKCSCTCTGACNCTPEFVQAECSWQLVCGHCFFSCRCLPC
jgi:hypothetical protein